MQDSSHSMTGNTFQLAEKGRSGQPSATMCWDVHSSRIGLLARNGDIDHTQFDVETVSIEPEAGSVFSGRATRTVLRVLDWLAKHTLPPDKSPAHQRTGRRGEEAAYFHLRKLGYTMVARNFRSPRCRGEIDLIGWEKEILCFVEVKTRSTRDVKPGEAAVDRHKRREVAAVVREYLRRLPPSCQWRFDVVSVYYGHSKASQPQIEVFRNSSLTA